MRETNTDSKRYFRFNGLLILGLPALITIPFNITACKEKKNGWEMSHLHWPKRLYSLDVTRGIAALAVVLWHWQHFAFNGSAPPLDFDSTSQPLYIPLKIFYERGDWAVQYFFLLSGFIFFWLYASAIAKKEISFIRFWIQRISRLYPLHLVTLIVVALL